MTTTFIDVPGPLTNTFEPIDFTTTLPVVSISVEFNASRGNGPRETVWDGSEGDGVGDFSFAYRNSTKAGAGPFTWSVRRSTRWPAEFRVRVQEVAEAPVVGQSWGAIYAVDFSTLPNQALSAGANVVDGKTWWVKGALGVDESLAIVNGAGLRFITRELQPGIFPYQLGAFTLGFQAYLDFAGQLSGYNPNAPCVLQWRQQDADASNPSSCVLYAALFSCPEDATRPTDAQRTGLAAGYLNESGGSHQFASAYANSSSPPDSNIATTIPTANPLNRSVVSLVHSSLLRMQMFAIHGMADSAAWPDISEPQSTYWRVYPFQSSSHSPLPRGANPNPSFGACLFAHNALGPAFPVQQDTIRAMRVLQPSVAP